MGRWAGKVAVVTGVSFGIGRSIAKDLLESGVKVIGLDRLEESQRPIKTIIASLYGNYHFYDCDISNLDSVKKAFAWIRSKFQHIHILVNNAGIIRATNILTENNESDLDDVIEVNVMGLIYCTKEAVKLMKTTDDEAYIINISSVAAHSIPNVGALGFGTLFPSKYAVGATTEILRQELQEFKTIRIASVSPGSVKTKIFNDHPAGKTVAKLDRNAVLDPEDISRAVLFILEQPEHVAIDEIIVKPRAA